MESLLLRSIAEFTKIVSQFDFQIEVCGKDVVVQQNIPVGVISVELIEKVPIVNCVVCMWHMHVLAI